MANTPYTNNPSIKEGSWSAQVNLSEMGPNAAFAAPDIRIDAPYDDNTGYADQLKGGVEGTPDAQRLGQAPFLSMHPVKQRLFYEVRDEDRKERYSVETVDPDGWNEQPGFIKRWVANPRENPPEPERPMTRDRSPNTYSYQRPMGDGLGERRFNGTHFSMADHRRDYDIYGMAPVRPLRNTYRLDPAPWDTNVVDMPTPFIPQWATTDVPSAPLHTGGSYRLS